MTDEITAAARRAFGELFASTREHFYYCTLVTTGEGHSPVVAAWSDEALERASEADREHVRWSYADSPYLGFGAQFFDRVEDCFASRPDCLDVPRHEWTVEFGTRMEALEVALRRLDAEGIFGTDEARDRLVLVAEVMPPDSSNTARALRLNSPTGAGLLRWLHEAAEPLDGLDG